MKFCKKCSNMLYIHSTENVVELKYTCRNCDYKEVDKTPQRCIYENVYSKQKSTHDIIYNKYTRHDATLPRINTIKCINSKCVSNKDYTNVLLLNDISVHRDRPEFDKKFEEIVGKLGIDRENIIQLDEDTIIIKSVSNLVETRSELEQIHHFMEYHEKLDSQIIFIKYDPDELRYVYICDYCNTSWKK